MLNKNKVHCLLTPLTLTSSDGFELQSHIDLTNVTRAASQSWRRIKGEYKPPLSGQARIPGPIPVFRPTAAPGESLGRYVPLLRRNHCD